MTNWQDNTRIWMKANKDNYDTAFALTLACIFSSAYEGIQYDPEVDNQGYMVIDGVGVAVDEVIHRMAVEVKGETE